MTNLKFIQNKRPFANIFIIAFIISLMTFTGCAVEGKLRVVDKATNTYIVDISAQSTSKENPLSVELDAGTYKITPISISDGGVYNAWKPWFYKPKKRSDGAYEMGWVYKYTFSSSEFPETTCTDSVIYETPALAFSHAQETEFVLGKNASVEFFIKDSPRIDNSGGVSLKIQSIGNSVY